jgi:hypothetical protein
MNSKLKNGFVLLFISLGCLIFSCKKDIKESESQPTVNTVPCPAMSGYTWTDAGGDFLGIFDSTDWQIHDTWNQCELNLFSGTNYNLNCVIADTNYFLSGYPNPTSNVFTFRAESLIMIDTNGQFHYTDTTTQVEIVVLGPNSQKLGPLSLDINHSIQVSLNSFNSNMSDTIFRVYYKLTDTSNCVRLGHGDIIRH